MFITAENLEKIDGIVNIWNHYCDIHGIEDRVYDMGQLDEELKNFSPTEIIDRLCDFNIHDDYFYWNNGWICSGNRVNIIDNVMDTVNLVKDINKAPEEYGLFFEEKHLMEA